VSNPHCATVVEARPEDEPDRDMLVYEVGEDGPRLELPLARPVAVLALHGQLAAVAWSFAQALPGSRLGYVQTAGGAAPGGQSPVLRVLCERGLLAGHLTAGTAFGDERETLTSAGALHHGLCGLGWDAAVCDPGPGIVDRGSALGHSVTTALDCAHTALALECPTLLVPRMSSGELATSHRGISQHTMTVLELLLKPVAVALPAGMRSPVGADLHAALGAVFGSRRAPRTQLALDVERPVPRDRPSDRGSASIARHDWRRAPVDLPAFAASGLPVDALGPGLLEDPLLFGAALAGGAALAELAVPTERSEDGEGAAA
jgi:hypothetical protein